MALPHAIRRALYAARPAGDQRRPRLLRRLFLSLALLPFALGLAGLLLISLVVDPYDVRPWGLEPRLADHRYPDVEWPLLLKVVTKEEHGLALIGASTLMPVSKGQLETAFGARNRPVNLAYPYAAPGDIGVVAEAAAEMPGLRRVLFVMDHSQMMGMEEKRLPAALRQQVFASNWARAGDFRWDTLAASWNRLVHGTYDRPAWRAIAWPEFFANFRPVPENSRSMARIAAAMARHRGDVLGGGEAVDCGRYPFLAKVLAPSLSRFRERGIAVDLVFPPYPYAGYYDWIDRRTSNDPFRPGAVYPQLMEFKSCVIAVAESSGGQVSVHAMDTDEAIAGHLGNYADNVHIIRPALFERVLDHVASRDALVSSASFDRFAAELGDKVRRARLEE